MLVAALLALTAAAPPQAPADLAGFYQSQQMEIGAAIELRKDGHFRYQLSYGAIDEESEGDWSFDGKEVRLTTRPMPTEPSFDIVRDMPAAKCTFSVSVDWGRFNWSSAPDVLVAYEGAPKELHFLQADDDGTLHPPNCAVISMLPIVPMFHIPGAPLKLAPGNGHKLSLRFEPNDLGRAAFRNEPLQFDGSSLVMQRYGAAIRFMPVQP